MAGRAALRLLRPVVERFEAEDGLWLGERALALVRPVVDQNDAIDRVLRDHSWTLVHGHRRADNLRFGEPGDRDGAIQRYAGMSRN